jgi:hypothetical protein
MTVWTIFVHNYENNNLEVIEIDSEDTFSSLRSKVSSAMGVSFNDLVLTGKEEYNYNFNAKKLSSIPGLYNECALYAVYSVGGGKY